jgi:hypothetical protein
VGDTLLWCAAGENFELRAARSGRRASQRAPPPRARLMKRPFIDGAVGLSAREGRGCPQRRRATDARSVLAPRKRGKECRRARRTGGHPPTHSFPRGARAAPAAARAGLLCGHAGVHCSPFGAPRATPARNQGVKAQVGDTLLWCQQGSAIELRAARCGRQPHPAPLDMFIDMPCLAKGWQHSANAALKHMSGGDTVGVAVQCAAVGVAVRCAVVDWRCGARQRVWRYSAWRRSGMPWRAAGRIRPWRAAGKILY